MKIIEGLKEIKRLEEKINDLNSKIQVYCADIDFETPAYPDQRSKINEWLQSVHDSLKEAMRIRIAIQVTNLKIIVPIELGETKINHSIAEWIIRRRLYAKIEENAWLKLTDRGLKDGTFQNTVGANVVVKIRRYFDLVEKDKKVEEFQSEPGIIDRTLEVINATTDLIE